MMELEGFSVLWKNLAKNGEKGQKLATGGRRTRVTARTALSREGKECSWNQHYSCRRPR